MEFRPVSIPNISKATVQDLNQLAQNDGRLRYSAPKGLFVKAKRTSDRLDRALNRLVDVKTPERRTALLAVMKICKANNMNLDEALAWSGLSVEEINNVTHYKVDLTTQHLNAVLSNCVQINKTWFVIEGGIGQGGFGAVLKARHGSVKVALKRGLQKETTNLNPRHSVANTMAREEDLLVLSNRMVDAESHVVATYGTATGLDGTEYLVMPLASGDAEEAVDEQRKVARVQGQFGSRGRQPLTASAKEELNFKPTPLTHKFLASSAKKPALILTVRDWIEGLRQLASMGIAHRDIKAGNYLLNEGKWVLTDLGTSGDEHDVFAPTPGIRSFQLTGNANSFAKSPEWLKGEEDASKEDRPFQVGLKDDVFSLGVAAYRLLTGGRFPFDGRPQQPDVSIAEFTYIDNLKAYVASEMPFSQWHEGHTGCTIPEAWKLLLDGALDSEPERRRSAEQLRALELFEDPKLDEPKVRRAILKQFNS